MNTEELFRNQCKYAIEHLDYEDYHSMGVEAFHNFVREHYIPIPRNELVKGKVYKGVCRNSGRAIWDGEKFHYKRTKFGYTYDEEINHFEEDDGYDVFVPIKEVF